MYVIMLVINSAMDTRYNIPSAPNGIVSGMIVGRKNPNITTIASRNTCIQISDFIASNCLRLDLLLCIFLFPS